MLFQYPGAVGDGLYLCVSAVSLGCVTFIMSLGFAVKKS